MFKRHAEKPNRLVAPFGFYGCGNIGDEATLGGFACLLALSKNPAKAWIGSQNRRHTALVEPRFRYFNAGSLDLRRLWAKWRSDVHAVIGGTPIMDVLGEWPLCDVAPLVTKAALRWRVPFIFIGVGVENLRRTESRKRMIEEIAPRVSRWSVRSDRDRSRLLEYGVDGNRITVAADMAWLIGSVNDEFGQNRLRHWGLDPGKPVIGVNLVNENGVLDRQPGMADSIAEALDRLSEDFDARVLFLSNEVRDGDGFDKAAAIRIISRLKQRDRAVLAPTEYFSPREMMSIIDCCALTVSMRYHFCLFSALQGVPFVAIERSDKVSDLCWDLQWKGRILPCSVTSAKILEVARAIDHKRIELTSLLGKRVEMMRERALLNAVPLREIAATDA